MFLKSMLMQYSKLWFCEMLALNFCISLTQLQEDFATIIMNLFNIYMCLLVKLSMILLFFDPDRICIISCGNMHELISFHDTCML